MVMYVHRLLRDFKTSRKNTNIWNTKKKEFKTRVNLNKIHMREIYTAEKN